MPLELAGDIGDEWLLQCQEVEMKQFFGIFILGAFCTQIFYSVNRTLQEDPFRKELVRMRLQCVASIRKTLIPAARARDEKVHYEHVRTRLASGYARSDAEIESITKRLVLFLGAINDLNRVLDSQGYYIPNEFEKKYFRGIRRVHLSSDDIEYLWVTTESSVKRSEVQEAVLQMLDEVSIEIDPTTFDAGEALEFCAVDRSLARKSTGSFGVL